MAADKNTEDEIVVTAIRAPLPISEVGASVTVIDAAEIEQKQYQFAADALADAAGLAIARNGAFGGQAALRIRGEASGRTLVVIDNVVVNDPSAPGGGFNFSALDVADIERIEILRGPQSILYGSEAIGGVVAITTKRGTGAPEATLFLEGGSFATFRGGASIIGAIDPGKAGGGADYGLTVTGITTNGISRADEADGATEADGLKSYSANANLGYDFTETFRVESSLNYIHARTEFDGFPPPNFTLADSDDEEESESIRVAGRALLTLFDGKFESIATLGFHRIDRQNFSGAAPTFGAEGGRFSAEYLGRFTVNDRVTIVAGAESERSTIDDGSIDDAITVNSVFALAAIKPIENFTITVGGRHDDHETFGGATTARATAAYNVPDAGLTLRGSWGEGFAAPSLFQLNFVCCGGAAPNRNLLPETSEGWDIGIDKSLGAIADLRVTYFRQVTEQLIDFNFATGAYVNIDATLRRGVETELSVRPLENIFFDVSYAFIKTEDRTTGLPLLRQPRHAVSVTGAWQATDKLNLSTTMRYNGEEADIGGVIASFTRVDLRGAYQFSDRLAVFGRIENVLDKQYQDVLGYGEPGLSGFAGVRVRL